MFKKFFSSLLVALLFFVSTGPTLAHEYLDVPTESPYFYPIDYLRRNDVFKNSPNFNPDVIISRAEFIKYLVILNSPDFEATKTTTLPFEDTRNNAWYSSYFKEAIRLGILSDRETKAEPEKKLNMIDALTLLFHSQSVPIPKVYKGSIPYKDVERNAQNAALIMQALSLGLIEPEKEDNVGIYRKISRKEAAKMIYRMDLANLAIGFGTSPTSSSVATPAFSPALQKIITAWELIHSSYIGRDEVNEGDLSDAAIRALAEQLGDPYSNYLDEEENSFFSDDLDGEIEGIGAFIGLNDEEQVIVISPIKGGPADLAGLRAGDVILKANGENLAAIGLEKAVTFIKGPRGTSVKLTILRNGREQIIAVTRDLVKVESLTYEITGNIMQINLVQFNFNTADAFREAVEIAQKNKEVKGILIDVRDNPGGLLDSVINILEYLVKPKSEIVTIQYSYFDQTQSSTGKGELSGYPMVVLVNKGSASASEILAGALKDLGLATLVGETTFGKGSVQELNTFGDGSSFKITVAKWLTPLGHSIDKNGIEPDIKVANPEDGKEDPQLQRALQELNRLINVK